MTEPKRITVQVTEELHYTARVKAMQERSSLSDVVRILIEMWLRGDVVLDEPLPEEPEQHN
jgi:hypothetical protein